MRNTAKKMKQSSYLPISIKLVLGITLIIIGFSVFGSSFLGVLLGLYLTWKIIKILLSCFINLLIIVALIAYLLNYLM